ncbi:hypothetical protein LCGC14_2099510, partial [marine sediment metagenome]
MDPLDLLWPIPKLPPPASRRLSIRDLGAGWKKTNPGVYDHLDDLSVGQAAKDVYPDQYQDIVPYDTEEALSPPYTPAESVTRAEENLRKIPPGPGAAART